ncbi:MAG: CsiV family protein [Woeseiaceae bacterium]
MKRFIQKIVFIMITATSPALLLAQDELLDEEQVPIKYYTVELIVFSYEENVGVGTEAFPPDQVEVPSDEIEEIVVEPMVRRHPDAVGLGPVFLTEEEFTMNDVVERLELLDAYDPVLHVGWTQAGFPLQDTDPLELAAFGEPPVGFSGSFTLYLARYLHLIVDLTMDAPVEVIEIEFDNEPAYTLDDISPPEGPVKFRILEDRIVKNGEVRYFDHPKFGVVAKVVRVEETKGDEDAESLLSRAVH